MMTSNTDLLRNSTVFGVLPEIELVRVASSMRLERFAAGERVIGEGERGDTAYLIADGEAGVVTRDLIGEEVTLRVFKKGEAFGEVALVEDSPRTATVRALTDLDVLVLDRRTFLALEKDNPAFAKAIREHVDLLSIDRFLKKASPFARVPADVIHRVAQQLVSVPVKAGESVVREGEEGDRFYVIRSGNFTVTEKGREVGKLGSGDVFGEIALLTGGPRIATVTALDNGEVLALSKADFDAVLKQQATFGRQLGELGRIRFRATTGQNLVLPDPITTFMPYLKTKSRDRYWISLLAGIAGFGASAFAFFVLDVQWAMLATLILGSFIVPIMYTVYMAESDILATRPGALALIFVVSAIAGIPISAGIQALLEVDWYSFGGALTIAAIEEPIKVAMVLWFLRRSTNRFRMDGLVFGAAAGMGFAAFETLLFGIGYADVPKVLVEALAVRSILAPLGHGTWTAITCAVIYGQNARGRLYDPRVLGAFALTIGLHTLWDWQPIGQALSNSGYTFYTWYYNLPWFLGIGAIGVLALRLLVNRAAQEEVTSIVALNPELVLQRGGRTSARGVKCQRCEQVAPVGAHYCVRCGAVLRVEQPAASTPPQASVSAAR
jgi:CRP-like cAMP-binding protein